MRLYIATPINALQGRDMKEKLTCARHRVELVKDILGDQPTLKTYEMFSTFDLPHNPEDVSEARAMGDCITAVLNCDAILLDHGWQTSKGCNLEYRAAKIYGKKIYEFDKLD